MPTPFNPPTRDSLAEVDQAKGVVYEDHCIVVEGVVSPSGQGGWDGPKEGYNVHNFALAGWRRPNEPLVVRELTVLRPVPDYGRNGQSFDPAIWREFPAYSIQRLSVLLSKNQTRAVFERVLRFSDPDESLLSLAKRLREPVLISTEQFGDLTLEPSIDWFEGKSKWNGKTIDIMVEKGRDGRIDQALKTAEHLWSDQASWKRKVDDFAVEKLLSVKNDSWLEEDEAELGPKAFKARMKLASISLTKDGSFTFWHKDGGLFAGHSIEIRGNLEDGLTSADIPG